MSNLHNPLPSDSLQTRLQPLTPNPNLVFIFSDRQRFDTLRVYGNEWIRTPHLNALAEESVVVRNCYVTQPVCAPARSSIITGLYPHTAGVPRNRLVMPPHIQTIAQMLPQEYRTAYFGKWHLGDEIIRQRGFDEWCSIMDRLWSEYTKPEYTGRFSDYRQYLIDLEYIPDSETPGGMIFSDEMRSNLPAEHQQASFLARKAEDFIRDNASQPFALYVSMLEPHHPFNGPYNHFYDPDTLPVDPSFLIPPTDGPLVNRLRSEYYMQGEFDGHDLTTESGWRRLRTNYFANISLVDDAVGRIVRAIERAGISDNTVLVFTSEHGDLVGSHAMLELRSFYDPVSRVPMLMRIPWSDQNHKIVDGNFSQIDIVPTLLDLMGHPVPNQLQGTSRADVFEGDATLDGNDVFIQHNGYGDRDLTSEESRPTLSPEKAKEMNYMNNLPWRSVVTADRWKLNLCPGDQCELFDLNTDPYEMTNLFNDPSQRDRIRQMSARIKVWQDLSGDLSPLPTV